jgi:hypothetical protein
VNVRTIASRYRALQTLALCGSAVAAFSHHTGLMLLLVVASGLAGFRVHRLARVHPEISRLNKPIPVKQFYVCLVAALVLSAVAAVSIAFHHHR